MLETDLIFPQTKCQNSVIKANFRTRAVDFHQIILCLHVVSRANQGVHNMEILSMQRHRNQEKNEAQNERIIPVKEKVCQHGFGGTNIPSSPLIRNWLKSSMV